MIPLALHAQPDYLANGPVWAVSSICANMPGTGGCLAYDDHVYTAAGDSLINGVQYARIMRSGSVTLWPMPSQPNPQCTGTTPYGPHLAALVRQQGRSLRLWDGQQEQLLYDFDLAVGDFLPISAINADEQVEVAAVDSLLMDGAWRRVFTLANSGTTHLVEGVGTDRGLLEPMGAILECGHVLQCFALAGVGQYPPGDAPCQLPNGIAAATPPALTIGPNPTSGAITIHMAGDAGSAELLLLDAQGRKVCSTQLKGNRFSWDVQGVPNGLYHLQVRTRGHTLTRAVAVMH